MALLNGMPIFENALLTEPEIVDRTWRERLFSWPWRPWRKQKVIQVPRGDVLVMTVPNLFGPGSTKAIVAHPHTAARIRAEFQDGR